MPSTCHAALCSSVGSVHNPAMTNRPSQPLPSRLLVYQMGKVGSKAVVSALRRSQLAMPVDHLHFLNDLDGVEAGIRRSWFRSGAQLAHLDHCRRIRREWERSAAHWYVITLVRDPLAREASAFFYNLDLKIRRWLRLGFMRRWYFQQQSMSSLRDRFLGQVNLDGGDYWFRHQFEPVFGIDLLSEPFPRDRGYGIHRRENLDVLVLKLEQLAASAEAAFSEFLGLEGIEVPPGNQARNLSYSETYKSFLESVQVPGEMLDQVYSSAAVRHFYSPGEIDSLRQRWS